MVKPSGASDDHPEKGMLVVQRIIEDMSGAPGGAARSRSGLSDARAQHPYPVTWRIAAVSFSDHKSTPIYSGWFTCWTISLVFILRIRRPCWEHSIAEARAIRCSSSSMRSMWSGTPTGSWMLVRKPGNMAGRLSTAARCERFADVKESQTRTISDRVDPHGARRNASTQAVGSSLMKSREIIWTPGRRVSAGSFYRRHRRFGSGKSTLVSQVLVEAVGEHLGHHLNAFIEDEDGLERGRKLWWRITRRPRLDSFDWWESTESRSAGGRTRTWRRTPACSITSGNSLPRPCPRAPALRRWPVFF